MRTRKRKELGQYIVADPEICGGQLTFKGTRIFVKDVLAMLAKGYDWARISAEFDGRLSHEAIAEAIVLASDALIKKSEKWRATIGNAYHRGYGKQPAELDLSGWAEEGVWPDE